MELCELIESLIDLAAEFHGYPDDRYVLTIISSSERPPHAMGFRLLDDDEQPHAMDPVFETEQQMWQHPWHQEEELIGIDVEDVQVGQQGAEIPQGQIVIAPGRSDHILVNGVEIFKDTRLATMREACTFHNLSTSGSRDRCFKRLFEH